MVSIRLVVLALVVLAVPLLLAGLSVGGIGIASGGGSGVLSLRSWGLFSQASRFSTMSRLNSQFAEPEDLPITQEDGNTSAACALTLGAWCPAWQRRQLVPFKPPPRGHRSCLWNCNHGIGVCDAIAGICRCPAGWDGDSCERRMRRPCSQFYRKSGFEPYDEPIDWNTTIEGLTLRCGGTCDDDIGMCFCPEQFPQGRTPPDPRDPPTLTVPRPGRPMGHHCQPAQHPETKAPTPFGSESWDTLFGPEGWCVADMPPPENRFPCHLDGRAGEACEVAVEHFCVNQCSGHGTCYLGWCACDEGYFGHDCAYRLPGVEWTPAPIAEKPWLKGLAITPAAADEGPPRPRPLVYVYEMAPMFNQLQLEYRFEKTACTFRLYTAGNGTELMDGWNYGADPGLHEMFLQSPHRTLDPEEADLFFMPVYTSCYPWPVFGAADFPWFHGGPVVGTRSSAVTNMWMEAWAWVRSRHPYWDRRGGRDHIIVAVHDEESCYVPEVLRNATMLVHWGRKDWPTVSGSEFRPDNYSAEILHPLWQPEGHVNKLAPGAPCYDPAKDLVVPAWYSPLKYADSELYGAPPPPKRDILAFFKGNLRRYDTRRIYSRGVRQRLAELCESEGWWTKHRVWINDTFPAELEGVGYSKLYSRSVFCFVLPGDGWSARMEDAVLHGCVPVVIQDDIDLPFDSILETSEYSVRVAEKDVDKVVDLLLSIEPERVAALQAGVRAVWNRFWYGGHGSYAAAADYLRNTLHGANQVKEGAEGEEAAAAVVEERPPDAFDTIMAWLHWRVTAGDLAK